MPSLTGPSGYIASKFLLERSQRSRIADPAEGFGSGTSDLRIVIFQGVAEQGHRLGDVRKLEHAPEAHLPGFPVEGFQPGAGIRHATRRRFRFGSGDNGGHG